MTLLKWEDKYSVGVKELDEQHKKIIEIINRISQIIDKNNFNDEDVGKIFVELKDYADYHFTNEEIYFREFDFDKTESHIKEHDDYRQKIEQMEGDYYSDKKKKIISDLSNFINQWWINHIIGTDKEYTECFHQHGLY
jgi:hemerythrin